MGKSQHTISHGPPRVLLAMLFPKGTAEEEMDKEFQEIESLITTYGGFLVVKKIQFRGKPDRHTFLGEGKIEEIVDLCAPLDIDIVIVNNILKPGQIYHIKEVLESKRFPGNLTLSAQVWDRVDLILKIFEKHASTAEARLQIELAALKHMGPRIFGMGMDLSRQGGGVGTRGKGETNTSIMKTHLSKMEKRIQDKIDQCQKVRATQRKNRQKRGFKQVAIVGYTNAGKSTLLNTLTKKGAYAADELFATLDTRTAKLYLPESQQELVLTDTIGFIKNLPPSLIDAFKSTLAETVHADALLHVIDLSNPDFMQHIEVVQKILGQIGIDKTIKQLFVFNKIDKFEDDALQAGGPLEVIKETFADHEPIFISTKEKRGLEKIKEWLVQNT